VSFVAITFCVASQRLFTVVVVVVYFVNDSVRKLLNTHSHSFVTLFIIFLIYRWCNVIQDCDIVHAVNVSIFTVLLLYIQ
jgi:TRAP-type C4-dicarboxylate transport system permease small subunit